MLDRVIAGVGIALALVPFIVPGLSRPWQLVAALGVTTVAALILAVYYYLRCRSRAGATQGEVGHRFAELENMNVAYRELLSSPTSKIRVLSYIGNFTWRSLLDASRSELDDVDLQLLIRDPTLPWRHPPSGCSQHERRMEDIKKVLSDFEERSEFQKMKHQLQKQERSSFVRFLSSEPQARVVVSERADKSRIMYVGFYSLQERADQVKDFSGTGRPVLRIADPASGRDGLIDDFVSWFDFVWQLQAPDPAPVESTKSE